MILMGVSDQPLQNSRRELKIEKLGENEIRARRQEKCDNDVPHIFPASERVGDGAEQHCRRQDEAERLDEQYLEHEAERDRPERQPVGFFRIRD
jgi:hypothetical protein